MYDDIILLVAHSSFYMLYPGIITYNLSPVKALLCAKGN
jgi:hypothetical protein